MRMLGVAASAFAYGGGLSRGEGHTAALAACVAALWWVAATQAPPELSGVSTPLLHVLQALVFRAAVVAATLVHEVRDNAPLAVHLTQRIADSDHL